MKQESFPCIICGKPLTRVFSSPAQPNHGVMCTTGGNYGSTVFDDLDGERLHFNICDACLVQAGRQGRVRIKQLFRNLVALIGPGGMPSVVGIEKFDSEVYEPWDPDAEVEPPSPRLISIRDLMNPPGNWSFHMPISQIIEAIKCPPG